MKVSFALTTLPAVLVWLAPRVLAYPVEGQNYATREILRGESGLYVRQAGTPEGLVERGLLDHVPGFRTKLLTAAEKEAKKERAKNKAIFAFQKQVNKHQINMAQIEAGGAKNYKLETKWKHGVAGAHDEMLTGVAHAQAHKNWEHDLQAKKYKHAEVHSEVYNHETGRIHTTVRYHHEGQNKPHEGYRVHMLSDMPTFDPKTKKWVHPK